MGGVGVQTGWLVGWLVETQEMLYQQPVRQHQIIQNPPNLKGFQVSLSNRYQVLADLNGTKTSNRVQKMYGRSGNGHG